MSNKTLIATYPNLEIAQKVVNTLTNNNHERGDIGLAVNETTKVSLVAVTIPANQIYQTMQLIEQHNPQKTDIRDTGWRKDTDDLSDIHPDAANFVAVDLTDESTS